MMQARIMKRQFGGLEAQKFEFDVEVLSASGLQAPKNVYVFWTRGPKVAMTKEVAADGEGNARFGQKLSLICTMYRSSSGEYQEKSTKLSVKEKASKKTLGEAPNPRRLSLSLSLSL